MAAALNLPKDADVRNAGILPLLAFAKKLLLRNNEIGRMEISMYISSPFKEVISALIENEPLAEGEYRLIPKAGSHYISLSPKEGLNKSLIWRYSGIDAREDVHGRRQLRPPAHRTPSV